MSTDIIWYRYGLRPGVLVTLTFTERPTVEDLGMLREYVLLHERGLRRHEQEVARPATDDAEAEGR